MARQARYPAHPGYTRTGRIGPTSNLKVGQVGLSVASAQVQAYIFARSPRIDTSPTRSVRQQTQRLPYDREGNHSGENPHQIALAIKSIHESVQECVSLDLPHRLSKQVS